MAIEANDGKETASDGVWRLTLLTMATNSRMMRLLKNSLRGGALAATVTAAILMGLNKETKSFAVAIVGTTPLYQTISAKFSQTPAFVYFVIANAIASGYNLLVPLLGFIFSKYKGYDITVHVLDMVMMALVATGAAAASSIAELGKHGNMHARWNPICDRFDDFCHRGGLAILSSFIGSGLLLLLNVNTLVALHKNTYSQL